MEIITAGEGWQARTGTSVFVDGHLYEGYQKHGPDVYIPVLDEELCFRNGTQWSVVVECIRKRLDLSQHVI